MISNYSKMKRCKRCILPENYPNIIFNKNGICNVCQSFDKKWENYDWEKKKKELEIIIKKTKAKKRRYDCIVPISGGKDSAYVLYICTQKYNMKVLAVNFNNGFVSPVAAQNLSKMAREFDADFISWGPKWSTLQKAYRIFFIKTGDFCPPCSRAITSFTYRLAQQEKIPLIILGFNPKTDNNPPEVEIIDQKLFKDVVRDDMDDREKKDFTFFEYRRFLTKRINLPSYIPFYEKKMINELEQAFGNVGGFSGGMHFDCLASPMADWLRRRKWGFGKKTQKYAALIRDGQMTRKEALAEAEKPEANEEPEVLECFMKMLDITRSDIDRAKKLSSLNFKHYNLQFIRMISKIISH